MKENIRTEKDNVRVIFAVTQHPHLGNLIEAFEVKLNDDGSFRMNLRKLNRFDMRTGKFDLSETDVQIIEIINSYNEENLVRKYNKSPEKFSVFIKKTPPEVLKKTVKPFVESKVAEVIKLLHVNQRKLYFKGKSKAFFLGKEIEFAEEEAKVVFHFYLQTYEMIYQLFIRYRDEQIDLYGKEAMFLSENPLWMLIDNRLYFFASGLDHKKLLPFFTKKYIVVPRTAINEYFRKFVNKVISRYEVEAVGFDIDEISVKPVALIELGMNWKGNYGLALRFLYLHKKMAYHDSSSGFVDLTQQKGNYLFRKYLRDKETENKYYHKLVEKGLSCSDNSFFTLNEHDSSGQDSLYNLLCWLNQASESLIKEGFEIRTEQLGDKFYTGKIVLTEKVVDKPDWFDLHIVVSFGDYSIPFSKLRSHIIRGEREFELPDGKVAILPEEWFVDYRNILLFGEEDNEIIRFSGKMLKEETADLLTKGNTKVKLSELFKIANLRDVDVPDGFQKELRPYQQKGYSWMFQMTSKGFGCCLADDMGLGKTVQALALLYSVSKQGSSEEMYDQLEKETEYVQLSLFEEKKDEERRNCSLIVMPTSLLHNWINEINKFTPELRYHLHDGAGRVKNPSFFCKFDLVLSSYGVVRNDIDMLKRFPFRYVVLDESQFIKNPDSKAFKAVIQLNSCQRIVLTGTPVENSLADLWAQMSFLNPGLLGDFTSFRNEFILPVERNKDEVRKKMLKSRVSSFILRRTKDEVAKDLPELTENVRYCEMTEEQSSFYEERKSEVRNYLLGKGGNISTGGKTLIILRALMTLRLAANHPILTRLPYDFDSGKFEEIKGYLEDLISEGHKVLVFSSFVRHLDLYARYLLDRQVNFCMLTGATPGKDRKQIIEDFQTRNDVPVFLLSIKAGGFGLNLTAADYVFILDPWWNPAVEMQALSRAHRIGQIKKVFVYRFITKNSIEEKIMHLQERKIELAREFTGSNNPLKLLNDDEIADLIS